MRITELVRPYRWKAAVVSFHLLIEMSFTALVPYSFGIIVDRGLIGGEHRLLVTILIGLAIGALVVSLGGLWRDYIYAQITSSLLRDIRNQVFAHMQRLSMDFYSRSQAGDLISHFSGDLATVENAVTTLIAWVVLPSLDVCACTVLLFLLNWQLALVGLVVWPLVIIAPKILAKKAEDAAYRRKEDEGQTLVEVQENIAAQPVVKGFGLEKWSARRFGGHSERLAVSMRRVNVLSAMVERSAFVCILMVQVLVVGFGAYLVVSKRLSIGSFTAFQTLFLSMSYSFMYATNYIPTLAQARAGLRRIEEVLDEVPKIRDAAAPVSLGKFKDEIRFHDVTFSYTGDTPNLSNASYAIKRGTSVAFVGTSGSGKSTSLNLITRFYDPTRGKVTLDGVDLREASVESLRSHMAVVFQESLLFNASAKDNVRLGKLDATDAEIVSALKAAEVYEAIEKIGFDTPLGERGSKLSGGQRQRVAIARALVRDPEIFILDEATSALDPATEASINATLERIAKGRTTVAVTHRLHSVTGVDQLFVMDQGRVIESGPHAELLAKGGFYAKLWQKQSGFEVSAEGDKATVTAARLRELSIFKELDLAILERVAGSFVTETFPKDRVVVHEGDTGDHLYVVARGEVDVSKAGKHIAILQDGDHFGEIALLKSVPRTATVKTRTASLLLSLRREPFLKLLSEAPHLREKLERQFQDRSNA